jgi:hypothetical protein
MPTASDPISEAGPLLDAVKRDPADAAAQGEASYCVIADAGTDARAGPRRRTRLRSGKIIDLDNGFLVECQIFDRSAFGARVRLVAPADLPPALRLFEDEAGDAVNARLVWRKGSEAGLRFSGHLDRSPLTPAERARLGGKYYAAGG